jgi:hypothetical protein
VHDHAMGYAVEPNAETIAEAIVDYYKNNRQEDYTQYLILEKEKYLWSRLTGMFKKVL